MFSRFAIFSCILFAMQFLFHNVSAQEVLVKTDYYNDVFLPTILDSATVKKEYYKVNGHWQIVEFNRDSINSEFYRSEVRILPDTSKKPMWKKYTFFYKNGHKKEYRHAEDTITMYGEHYSEKGKKDAIAIWKNDSLISSKGWDTKGKLIPHFVYEKFPVYPGGDEGWKHHLFRNLRPDVAMENGAPAGKNYTVNVGFLVDKTGKVTQVKAENNPGYGTAQESERVIKVSEVWMPAIYMNKKVVYHQRQQITFQVLDDDPEIVDENISYLNKNYEPTSKDSAVFKSIKQLLNDSTLEMKTYFIQPKVFSLVQDYISIKSVQGVTRDTFRNFDTNGRLASTGELVNNKITTVINYHPNGKKAEEIIYGNETDLPIKSTRWDETGKLIP